MLIILLIFEFQIMDLFWAYKCMSHQKIDILRINSVNLRVSAYFSDGLNEQSRRIRPIQNVYNVDSTCSLFIEIETEEL